MFLSVLPPQHLCRPSGSPGTRQTPVGAGPALLVAPRTWSPARPIGGGSAVKGLCSLRWRKGWRLPRQEAVLSFPLLSMYCGGSENALLIETWGGVFGTRLKRNWPSCSIDWLYEAFMFPTNSIGDGEQPVHCGGSVREELGAASWRLGKSCFLRWHRPARLGVGDMQQGPGYCCVLV